MQSLQGSDDTGDGGEMEEEVLEQQHGGGAVPREIGFSLDPRPSSVSDGSTTGLEIFYAFVHRPRASMILIRRISMPFLRCAMVKCFV